MGSEQGKLVAKFNVKGIRLKSTNASISAVGWNTGNLLALRPTLLSFLNMAWMDTCLHLTLVLRFSITKALTFQGIHSSFIEVRILKQVTVKSYWSGCLFAKTLYLRSRPLFLSSWKVGMGRIFCWFPYSTEIKAYSPLEKLLFLFLHYENPGT